MQGWRKTMEDSHISEMNLLNGKIHIFGVFDGHGGEEVAQYVKKNFTKEIKKSPFFISMDMENALIENFLLIDKLLIEPEGKSELRQLYKISNERVELKELKELKELEEFNDKEKKADKDIHRLNKQIYNNDYNPKSHEECNIAMISGCTAHACIIDEVQKKLFFANSGDSRGVLCKNGKSYAMSVDHKPDLEMEKLRIYKADGFVSEGRVKGKKI
jgi:protein phosphatase 1G